MLKANPIDMTTLAAVKQWNSIFFDSSDSKLQGIITGLSMEFLRLTSRGNRNLRLTDPNPFVQPVDYDEIYDGNGNNRMFLRNMPINSLTSVSLGSVALPLSDDFGVGGVRIDNSVNAIVIPTGGSTPRSGYTPTAYSPGRLGRGGVFPRGTQNIEVVYNAGFARQIVTDELQTIPEASVPSTGSTPPTTANVVMPAMMANGWNLLANTSVAYFEDGAPLEQVHIAPTEGQYFLQPDNTYLFSADDAGKQILLNYEAAGTPADIVESMNQWVGLNNVQSKSDRIGVKSLAMKDVGSTVYSTYAMDPSVQLVISNYSRNYL